MLANNEKAQDPYKEIKDCIQKAQYFKAHNLCIDRRKKGDSSLTIKQLFALSLIRIGQFEKASTVLEPLYYSGENDPETSGLMGRVFKDFWKNSGEEQFARISRDTYLQSYKKEKNYYTGINAATMSLFIDEREFSIEFAKEIIDYVQKLAKGYWSYATLGEAFFITGDLDSSLENYKRAAEIAKSNFGDFVSTIQQFSLLKLAFPDINVDEFLKILYPPQVAVFTGHMIDSPERKEPRFPDYLENEVRIRLRETLAKLNVSIVYTSAACGSDIILIEEMLKRNGEVNVFLPFRSEDFIESSIRFAGDNWVERFHQLIPRVNLKYITEEPFLGEEALFSFTGSLLMGFGILRSRVLHSNPLFLALLDKQDISIEKGGSRYILSEWPKEFDRHILDIGEIRKNFKMIPKIQKTTSFVQKNSIQAHGLKREIKCIFFADIVGFSRLEEIQTPYFMFEFMTEISKAIFTLNSKPEVINTWGDAIFATFENAKDMIQFAMLINQKILSTDWTVHHLPKNISIRIALHCGPIYQGIDPITKNKNAYGSHINRTARMEPVTLPGSIYASEHFAAKLLLETGDEYKYNYVGVIDLAKNFGAQEIYKIQKSE
jgi:hypothetical protein